VSGEIGRRPTVAQAAGCEPGKRRFSVLMALGVPIELDSIKRYRDAGVHQVVAGAISTDAKKFNREIERMAEKLVGSAVNL
jgi:hypothetical protein